MDIDPDLLEILRCPETRQRLRPAGESLLAQLNARIAEGTVTNAGGEPVTRPVAGGLVREDGSALYPVTAEGIPVLLVEEAIPLEPA